MAQTYHPMLKEGRIWDVGTHDKHLCSPDGFQYNRYELHFDAVIDGRKMYDFDMYINELDDWGCYIPEFSFAGESDFWLYEDTLMKWVVRVPKSNPHSMRILYDFSLDVGDYFMRRPVIRIDTFIMANGDRRRVLVFPDESLSQGEDWFVEGIGSLGSTIMSPFYNSGFQYSVVLSCYQENGVSLLDGRGRSCNMPYGKVKVKSLPPPRIRLYPNPAKDVITLRVDPGTWEYQIVTLSGRHLDRDTIEGNTELTISDYPRGIYVVIMWNRDTEESKTLKFIKT